MPEINISFNRLMRLNHHMRKIFIATLLLFSLHCFSQNDSTKWLRAFPVTDYMVDLNDSVKLVQIHLHDGLSLKEKQLGVLYGIYNSSKDDAVQKGYGRCQLIKGDYYYFSIGNNKSGKVIQPGDLLYASAKPTGIYFGLLPKLASHYIQLDDVYDNALYDRYSIFLQWEEPDEMKALDSIRADIKFTGNYFQKNDPSVDKLISSGPFKGKKTLEVMINCRKEDIRNFFEYILARPRLYAGKEWKVSEIFATWLSEGAPMVIKE